jgi:hypothetical protein
MQGIRTSLLGRYTEQNENESRLSLVPVSATSTRSLTIAADFHPSVTVNRTLNARVGVNARGGLLVSRASTLDFGSIDYGGGVWASAGKDFSRVRIGLGGTFQGSKSHLPLALLKEWEEVEDLAREFNTREVIWDFSYGVLGGILVTERTSLNGKVLQTKPFGNLPPPGGEGPALPGEGRPVSTIVMGSVSYLVGGLTPVDVGYKVSTGDGITTQSVFLQGYFGF